MVDLDELERLHRDATPAPWCQHPNGTSVWTGSNYDCDDRSQRHLLNTTSVDETAVDNTTLVCEMRNALPELIRLARIGLATEQKR